MSAKRALGKGLGALIQEPAGAVDGSGGEIHDIAHIEIAKIKPNPDQPRRTFAEDTLRDLAESIRAKGVIQPILVERLGDGYSIVAGERRFRAAQLAGLKAVPAIIGQYTDQERLEISLVENIQREDLNPLEEAAAFKALLEGGSISQEELSGRVGKNRSTIANSLRLLKLSKKAQSALANGEITSGHARAVLSVTNPADRDVLLNRIRGEGLSVRAAESTAEGLNAGSRAGAGVQKKGRSETKRNVPPELLEVEERLIEALGTKVALKGTAEQGRIEVSYYSQDDLDRIIGILSGDDS